MEISTPSRTRRFFAKIGIGRDEIDKYDSDCLKIRTALKSIEKQKIAFELILSDKKQRSLIREYNEIREFNAEISNRQKQLSIENSEKLEKSKIETVKNVLTNESAWSTDWTPTCDPARDIEKFNILSNNMSM